MFTPLSLFEPEQLRIQKAYSLAMHVSSFFMGDLMYLYSGTDFCKIFDHAVFGWNFFFYFNDSFSNVRMTEFTYLPKICRNTFQQIK